MTTASRTAYVPDLKAVGKAVDERIRRLQGGYLRDESAAVATLAKIRRGAGKTIEEVPELVGLTIDHDFYETFDIHDPRTPDAETAVHEALTLYALHQHQRSCHFLNGPVFLWHYNSSFAALAWVSSCSN